MDEKLQFADRVADVDIDGVKLPFETKDTNDPTRLVLHGWLRLSADERLDLERALLAYYADAVQSDESPEAQQVEKALSDLLQVWDSVELREIKRRQRMRVGDKFPQYIVIGPLTPACPCCGQG